MITFFSLSSNNIEYQFIKNAVLKCAALYTEQKWNYVCFQNVIEAENYLKQEPLLDMVSWDITLKDAQKSLENMRKTYTEAFLIVVADTTISPITYLKPKIAPKALLLKPVNKYSVENVIQDIFEVFLNQEDNNDVSEEFLIETREQKQFIPIKQIDYFEAKEKKIFVRTKSNEYSFYDTLGTLEQKLPPYFIRCHRSYIVNMKRAKKLLFSENSIELIDDVVVPFSRSYKKVLKEYWKYE